MRRVRAKQLKQIAIAIAGNREPTPSKTYKRAAGQFMYPGNSTQGRYIQLKKRYYNMKRNGMKPWIKTNKMEIL